MEERVLDFFKTFADANRLRLAALLIDESISVETMASRLGMRASDLPRQLAMLERLDLLESEDGYYRLNTKALETLSREVLSGMRPAVEARSNDDNADAFDRSVVKNYSLPDGRLREIPGQARKRQAVLRHVVQVFEPGVHYNEKQVNEALKRFHADYASLRRYLFDDGLIERASNGSEYWRKE